MKKFLAIFLALTMCVSLGVTAFAAPDDETTTVAENTTVADATTVAEATTAANDEATTVADEATTVADTTVAADETTTEAAEESTTTEEQKKDILELVMAFLQSIKFDEVKDTLNDIGEALGFPRVETVADLAKFADAIVDKLGDAGLSYEQIVNMIKANDLIEWLEGLFKKPVTTTAADSEATTAADAENGEKNPHTGISAKAALSAAATVSLAAAVLFVLKKRAEAEVTE